MKSPLDGIKILDLTIFQNGPWATVMLSDMGADVLKIEDPVNGDPARGTATMTASVTPIRTYFETMNRNKRSMTLNLKAQEGREIFYCMAKKADVVVQNFRVGVVEKLGVDYETIRKHNPDIVYASNSGFGSKGPDARDGVFDVLGQARGGLMFHASHSEDEVTVRVPGSPADQVGALLLTQGILLGIIARQRHGVGQHVECSQLGGQLVLQALGINGYLLNGVLPKRGSRRSVGNPLMNTYRCSDGRWIALGCAQSDRFWPGACRALEVNDLLDDPRFRDLMSRDRNCVELIDILDRIFAGKPQGEWLKVLKSHGLFCAPVQSYADLPNDPQVIANEFFAEVSHPTHGTLREVGVPLKLSATPGAARSRAPEFGEHTEQVLLDHGYTWEQIADFRGRGIV